MRFALLLILAALFVPAAAIAQSATPTSPGTTAAPAARTRGGDITRDDYVERAAPPKSASTGWIPTTTAS